MSFLENMQQRYTTKKYDANKKVIDSAALVVFSSISNSAFFEKQIETHLPAGAVGYYKQFIKPLPETEIKHWMEKQVYIALGVLLSACANMGIDATPMEGIQADDYDRILNTPDHHALVAVAMGFRDPQDANQPSLNPKSRRAIQHVITAI